MMNGKRRFGSYTPSMNWPTKTVLQYFGSEPTFSKQELFDTVT